MAPLLYISAFLSAIAAACLAEIVTVHSQPGRQALAERPKIPADYRFLPPVSDTTKTDLTSELDLLDLVLIASVDGKFHALNRTSGHTLWSMSSFPSSTKVSAPATLGPLIRTNHIEYDPEMTDDNAPQEMYIIEPQSGDIYVMATPTSSLQRFPFSMAELVDMSPFSFSGDDDRRVFVGKKTTSLLLVELETGKLKATLNSECPWDPFEDLHNDDEVDLDELDGTKPPVSTPTEVFIGRTDYHISIYTRPHTRNAALPRPPVQNLSFSTYGPNNQDNHFQTSYRRTKDDVYMQSLPNGEIMSFKARARGENQPSTDSQLLWGRTFDNPIVAIFDVLRKPDSTRPHSPPFVLLQPRPRLQDVIPNLTQDTNAARLPNLDSAYVGMVQETGSLFAMSPSRFPLVVFGGTERHPKYHSIDAPLQDDHPDVPSDVDAITKARKYKEVQEAREREMCMDNASGDPKCFIGVRRLDDGDGHESRMRRLLDGVPGVGNLPSLHNTVGNTGAQPMDVIGNNESIDGTSIGGAMPTSVVNQTHGDNLSWTTGRSNLWEAVLVACALGIISLWFGMKRMKGEIKKANLASAPQESTLDQTPEVLSSVEPVTEQVFELVEAPSTPIQPPRTPRSVSAVKLPSQPNGIAVDDGDDSEREGEGEGDGPATPGKRKARRGKRGKKKKTGNLISEDGDGDGQAHKENGPIAGSDSTEPDPVIPPSLIIQSSPPPPAATAPSLIVSDTVLGFGSHGTVVFQGSLQGRSVAVKRLLQDFVTLASREVSILQESDDHPNVIRYYYQEAHANFLYIALELCPASLADIVECPDRDAWRDIAIAFDPKKALRQITSGLRHLHALKLVHRDIKPQNILVSSGKVSGHGNGKVAYRMLISDFGLCKKLDVDQTSFLPTAHGAMAAGTVGWRAPEILRGEVKLDDIDDHSLSSRGSTGTVTGSSSSNGKPTRLTKSVDIFALGCLFYYTLTNGGHPFGDRFEREGNIMKNFKNLDGLERFGEEGAEGADLVTQMLSPEASQRPDTTSCLLHPFFWDSGRRLNFLQDASDRFEIMCRDPKDPYLLLLEKEASSIVGNDWHSRLDKIFIENLGKFRKYDGRSVQDLLRALRNKKHHYQDLPDNVKRHLGPMPEGFLSYFTRRYPRLFLHVHSVIGVSGLRSESMFRSYFELPD